MSDPRYSPDEPFSLDEDPEDVLRKILGAESDEETVEEAGEEDPT